MTKPDICIHHMPCADGFTAAWAVWRRWPDIEFHPGVYGEEPPDVTGKDVLIVDFSYKRPVLEAMAQTAASIRILDHHKSAEADLVDFAVPRLDGLPVWSDSTKIQALFDMNKSGARLTWEYVHSVHFEPCYCPAIVLYVEDRDLWRFTLPDSREVAAELFSRDYDFATWNDFANDLETPATRGRIVAGGAAIERKHFKDIGELLKLTTREMVIGGQRVKVANLPYTMSSDAANMLSEGAPFGACYYDNADGKRVFSLRSKDGGADVSEIAVAYGGGGHARASGFQAPGGWEGDAR
jgi:hypothetical protein